MSQKLGVWCRCTSSGMGSTFGVVVVGTRSNAEGNNGDAVILQEAAKSFALVNR